MWEVVSALSELGKLGDMACLIPHAPLDVTALWMRLPGRHMEGMTFQDFRLIVEFAIFTKGGGGLHGCSGLFSSHELPCRPMQDLVWF
jgi:hypothetical protein